MNGISLIFLDIDGVLNPNSNIRKQKMKNKSTSSYYIELHRDSILHLRKLVRQFNARIVISSSWRIGGFSQSPAIINLTNQLRNFGLYIYAYTPILSTGMRGDEIREFIANSPVPVKSFVILDDDSDMCEFTNSHLVLCPSESGFGINEYHKAIKVLSKNSIQIYNSIKINERNVNNG